MIRVIFACIHNAGRTQMDAAFFNVAADLTKAPQSPPELTPGRASIPRSN
jgi:hypothetical protein